MARSSAGSRCVPPRAPTRSTTADAAASVSSVSARGSPSNAASTSWSKKSTLKRTPSGSERMASASAAFAHSMRGPPMEPLRSIRKTTSRSRRAAAAASAAPSAAAALG